MPPGGGWYRMHRGWQDDPAFAGEPHSRRSAWVWLIENAAWEDHHQWFNGHRIAVARGELVVSYRGLAKAWGWSLQRVRTFMAQLQKDEKLTHIATHPATHIKLCNYDKYQSEQNGEQHTEQHTGNTGSTHNIRTEEGKEEKNLNADKSAASYAFFGQTIRLAPRHLSEWRRIFHSISDIEAELSTLDDWWQSQAADKRGNWFLATKGMLNKRHQENVAARRDYDPDRITV